MSITFPGLRLSSDRLKFLVFPVTTYHPRDKCPCFVLTSAIPTVRPQSEIPRRLQNLLRAPGRSGVAGRLLNRTIEGFGEQTEEEEKENDHRSGPGLDPSIWSRSNLLALERGSRSRWGRTVYCGSDTIRLLLRKPRFSGTNVLSSFHRRTFVSPNNVSPGSFFRRFTD